MNAKGIRNTVNKIQNEI